MTDDTDEAAWRDGSGAFGDSNSRFGEYTPDEREEWDEIASRPSLLT